MSVRVCEVGAGHEAAFLDAVRRSAALHGHWVSAPGTPAEFAGHLARFAGDAGYSFLSVADDGSLVGCINISEVVRGAFQSAYLGYYAFVPNAGRGLMKEAMSAVISEAFGSLGLHRLEANVQPGNDRSAGLVRSLGFRLEGFSPRYLRIGGEWRDHERYAITAEEWPGA